MNSQCPDDDTGGINTNGQESLAITASIALRLSANLMKALACYPGPSSTESEMSFASREILERSSMLSATVIQNVMLRSGQQVSSADRTRLKQFAFEASITLWCYQHQEQNVLADTDWLCTLFDKVLTNEFVRSDVALNAKNPISEQVALISIAPQIYQSVNQFNYFNPDPESLVKRALTCVINAVDSARNHLARYHPSLDLSVHLIEHLGALYSTTYQAHARRDLLKLREMDEDERAFYIEAHPAGLPTEHIDTSFTDFANRLIKTVIESIPESTLPLNPIRMMPGA